MNAKNTTKYMLRRTREALQAQLKYLEQTARPENSKRKNEAYVTGGTHENSAWEVAVQDEKVIDHHISVARWRLQESTIIEDLKIDPNRVGVGCVVVVEDLDTSEEFRYVCVGSFEGGPRTLSGLLVSVDAPVGQALLGSHLGDVVKLSVGRPKRLIVRSIYPYVDDRSADQLL